MLAILLKTINPDIVCLTETWLNPINENQEVIISQSYSIQSRSDRKLGPHAGVLIAHRNTSCQVEVLRTNSDFICCSLYFFSEVTIVIITISNPQLTANIDSVHICSAKPFRRLSEMSKNIKDPLNPLLSF